MPGDDERGTKQRDTHQRSVGGRDILIDAGLGPRVVVAVVRKTPPPPLDKQLARWVPPDIRDQLRELEQAGAFDREKLVNRPGSRFLSRFPRPPRDGNIVVWVGTGPHNVEVQVYREFPEDESVYLELTDGDEDAARLLIETLSQFNRDLWHLVHDVGMSPERARAELRQISDEVFRLVLEAAALMITSGAILAAIKAFGGRIVKAIRGKEKGSRQQLPSKKGGGGGGPKEPGLPVGYLNRAKEAVKRLIAMLRKKGKPIKVDIGGKADRDYINVNPDLEQAGPFPNWVQAFGEEIGELFPPGSVDEFISENLVPPPNWQQIAQGASSALKPGGKVAFHQFNAGAQGVIEGMVKALKDAGFKDIVVEAEVIVRAIKP